MERKRSLRYLKAKKKVEALKGFYGHLTAYVIVNIILILVNSNVLNGGEIDFLRWDIYVTAIFWGVGLLFHALYLLYIYKVDNNIFKRWEEKKIKEIMAQQDSAIERQTQEWE